MLFYDRENGKGARYCLVFDSVLKRGGPRHIIVFYQRADRGKEKRMVHKTIEYRKIEHVGLIHFRDNVKDQEAIARLPYEISEVSAAIISEDDIWVVVLTGVGKSASLLERDSNADIFEIEGMEDSISLSVTEPIADIEKPVIVGINGEALGQGFELVLTCDIRIATEKSRFGLPQLEKGLIPWNGGTQRLARLVGKGKALEMILTGVTIDAQEAYRIGLVNNVVSSKELEKTVMHMAGEMTSKGPIALKYAKEAINTGMDLTLEQGLHLEADLYMLLHTSRDRTEGIRAFREKRKPQFKGK